ncbi:MAG: hypothetical protein HY080_01230 [Gammaproteobacteria bacterium]|nr:hypothetical protein [Gammaproteobacteria bacterium]
MENKPQFPLKVVFHETDEEWVLENENEAAFNLEYFDSDDKEERATVTDNLGRAVRLKIRKLEIVTCELKPDG